MSEAVPDLIRRIAQEIHNLDRVVGRIVELGRKLNAAKDCAEGAAYCEAIALNLHSFYAGLERLFVRIAASVDRSVPQGAEWHKKLLDQMSTERAGVRPAVISGNTCSHLQKYLAFRHVVRHAYTFDLDARRVREHAETLETVFHHLRIELVSFNRFLEQTAHDSRGNSGHPETE